MNGHWRNEFNVAQPTNRAANKTGRSFSRWMAVVVVLIG